ncbi:hypothetical protein H4S04_006131 [Coemansia sp. S16]|nr:hypothetical protein H4S04_006131 [Coemansia sp. S16]
MDNLLRDIQPQTIDLCIFDLIPSFLNIPFYFYYGNDAHDSDFMRAEQLRESFYMALLEFPIIVGHLETDGSGHAKVVVDPDNLNIPEFLESQSSVHFRDLRTANSLLDIMPEDRKALDDPTLELITTTGPLVRWLAWISPKTRGMLLNKAFSLMSVVGHTFHFSTSRLASLRASVQGYLSSDVHLSDNDILTALLSMVIAQSQAEYKRDSASASYLSSLASYLFPSMYEPDSSFVTQVVIDTRPRLKGLSAAKYTGNSVLTRCLVNSMESLTSGITEQSLAPIAKGVRQLVNGVDSQYIGQYVDTLHKDLLRFMCPATYAFTKTTMLLSNQSRLPSYKADFGNGIPTWVSSVRAFFPNFSSIMPAPPLTGGYVVYISMAERAMAKLLQNEFWMSTNDMLY